MKSLLSFAILLLLSISSLAQKKDDSLLKIGEQEISASEFKRVYLKNLELVQEESQRSIDGYMQLFIDYKLKVAEAYAQDLHLNPVYQQELSNYQDQLSRNYIYDDKLTTDLAREAYERGLEEIEANHILISVAMNDLPQDTLAAYNKIASLRERALAGEDFETLARTYSDEPNASESTGYLGYFSVFSMLYPFETMAYHTKVGEVSDIVRTIYGYHILKIKDRRPRSPMITVSHVMIADGKGSRDFDPEQRIREIYALYKQGQPFEELAKQYSEDKGSAKQGGKLRKFGKGQLRSRLFEEKAYTLSEAGEVSEPFKSEFGWHFIRLEEVHQIPAYEEEKSRLEERIKNGNRSKVITSTIQKKIKSNYGFSLGEPYLEFFDQLLTDDILKRNWEFDPASIKENKRLFTIGDKDLSFTDFASYMAERQKKANMPPTKGRFIAQCYAEFESIEVENYFKDRLEDDNEEYAAIMAEYRDGLLIFEVMSRNVWQKAREDSLGLQKFYKKNLENYQWKERVDAIVVSAPVKMDAQAAAGLLGDGLDAQSIKEQLNTEDVVKVVVTEDRLEPGDRSLPRNFKVVSGVSDIYEQNGSFMVVKVKNRVPPGPMNLDEVRGRAMSDYQNYLEAQWLESLRSKYKVELNKKTLKKIKKELES